MTHGDRSRTPGVFFCAGLALPVVVDTVTVLVAAARRKINSTVTCCGARNDQTEVAILVALSHGVMLPSLNPCRAYSQIDALKLTVLASFPKCLCGQLPRKP